MAWGALVKSVAKGAIQKKAKKKGAEMAKNITNKKEKDNSSAIVVREKSTSLVGPLLSGGDSTDSSSNTSKKSRSRSPLDRIHSSLKDIMKTLKKRRKLMLNKSRRMRVQADKEKKAKREGILERVKETGKKMVGNIAKGAKGWWEKLQRFLLMTLLGSLVMAIKDNWEAIKVQIDKVVNIIKGIWEFMSPVLIPLFKALKWITIQGFKMMAGIVTADKKQIEQETDQASNELESIKKETEGVTKQFKESEKNIKNISNTKEPNLDTKKDETGLSESEVADGVTTDNLGRKIKTDDEGVKLMKGSDGWKKADDRPLSVTNPEIKKNTRGRQRNRKKYNVGGYVTRDGEVHKGEYVIKENIVKKVGVNDIENVIKTMMQTSIKNIQQNPLKIISIMEGMSKEFAPIGEQIPGMINETIKESKLGTVSKKVTREMVEKMEKTLTVLKEQTEYEDPSGSTVFIPVPTPSQPPMGEGGSSGETTVIMGESGKAALNRYVNAVIQKALY